jgi:PAS domain S-box-containing protein
VARHPEKSQAQTAAEAEVERFHRRLGPFVVAADETRMPLVFTNAQTQADCIIFANASFLMLTGCKREHVLGEPLASVIGRGSSRDAMLHLAVALDKSHNSPQEIHFLRNDGDEVWVVVLRSPVKNDNGDLVQYFLSFHDITENKKAQREAHFLIDELNHRVKNTLATVQSIVSIAFRNHAEPAAIRAALESRLFALSRSHDLLNRVQWKEAGLADVIHAALEPFESQDGLAARLISKGENIRVSPKITLALSIALNELATNAVKYGALSNDTGSVLVEWFLDPTPDHPQLTVFWQERNGPPVRPPLHNGFGSQVIERGTQLELQAEVQLEYRPEGVACTFHIPMAST